MRRLAIPLLLLLLAVPVGCASPPATKAARDAADAPRAGLNDRFLSPDLDVEELVGIFEGESREIFAERHRIVERLELAPGMRVADVGAGTGLFLKPLAEGVGETGKVYAVDISPKLVEYMRNRVREEDLAQVEVVQCSERSADLPEASVDLVFVCDTYHHFSDPASTMASLRAALRPGGRLVVVDFEKIPGVSRDWVLGHVRADKRETIAEIEAAGFVLEDEPEVEGLKENYLLRFRRP